VTGEDDLERADAELLQGLDHGFDEASRRAGAWVACGPGCSECCIGPFPITRLDARRLRRGLSDLSRDDPERARRILDRALGAARALEDGYPGDAAHGRLSGDVDTLDRFFERHGTLPCPVLDPTTGRCELYPARPVSCRTYGPPLRFFGENAPPCPLCFKEAPTAIVERCRFEPDPRGLEDAILSKMGVRPGDDWETLIPFAFLPDGEEAD
jgi:Fe-S-cluster containining protein